MGVLDRFRKTERMNPQTGRFEQTSGPTPRKKGLYDIWKQQQKESKRSEKQKQVSAERQIRQQAFQQGRIQAIKQQERARGRASAIPWYDKIIVGEPYKPPRKTKKSKKKKKKTTAKRRSSKSNDFFDFDPIDNWGKW